MHRMRAPQGSTTVVALLMLSTLAALGGTMLFSISNRYNSIANNVAWRQAINSAESAANFAIANMNWNIAAVPVFPRPLTPPRVGPGPMRAGLTL